MNPLSLEQIVRFQQAIDDLLDRYPELQELLRDWSNYQDLEIILERRAVVWADIETLHKRLDEIQGDIASDLQVSAFSLKTLQESLPKPLFERAADSYQKLVDCIRETNTFNQELIKRIEADKRLTEQELIEFYQSRRLHSYSNAGAVEPRFFDHKK
jgi:uncharacterized membrane-anchored protein YhcB (DUF1043 family)